MTVEQEREDLAHHEAEVEQHTSFNYALFDADEAALLGCVYIDPPEKSVRTRRSAGGRRRCRRHPDRGGTRPLRPDLDGRRVAVSPAPLYRSGPDLG
jgi:hypothetical protein